MNKLDLSTRRDDYPVRRILFIDKAAGTGGSLVSLYRIVCALDRRRYQPFLLLFRNNPYRVMLESLGVPVLSLQRSLHNEGRSKLEGTLKRTTLATSLKRFRVGAGAYHAAGFSLRLCWQTLPDALRIRNLIRDHGIHLVHLNDQMTTYREAILACRLAAIPCVCHYRQYEQPSGFDRFISRHIDYSIYISDYMRRCWEKQVYTSSSAVIVDGLELRLYLEDALNRPIREQYGLRDRDLVVGNVGRLIEWKGHEIILRALARLKECLPDLRCLIVGDPDPPERVDYRRRLDALVDELGLRTVVHFVPFTADVPRVLASLDILIHSAVEPEPFGLTIIEGMAAGRAVIASNAGGVPEIIEHGVTGILTPPGDVDALVQAIADLARDRDRIRTLGLAARRAAEERYSLTKMVVALERVYDSLLSA